MQQNWDDRIREAQKDYSGYAAIQFAQPDITFTDAYDFEGGKNQIRYYGPGHAEDGVVVYFPE